MRITSKPAGTALRVRSLVVCLMLLAMLLTGVTPLCAMAAPPPASHAQPAMPMDCAVCCNAPASLSKLMPCGATQSQPAELPHSALSAPGFIPRLSPITPAVSVLPRLTSLPATSPSPPWLRSQTISILRI